MQFKTFPLDGCLTKIIRLSPDKHKDVKALLLNDTRPQRGENPRATIKHAYVGLCEIGLKTYKSNPDYYGLRFVDVKHVGKPTSGIAIAIPKDMCAEVSKIRDTWEMTRVEDTYIRLIEIGLDAVEADMVEQLEAQKAE